ncbi:hypothetical protein T296_07845 [Pantoea agglomerans Eh318]|nr:hypothetical protein T296_07845 [Pantoea agglomerans Eh318]
MIKERGYYISIYMKLGWILCQILKMKKRFFYFQEVKRLLNLILYLLVTEITTKKS